MRKWIGAACVILGILSLLGAVGLVLYNRWDAENAEKISESFLKDVQIAINAEKVSRPTQLEQEEQTTVPSVEIVETVPVPSEMATVQVDGYDCIGILSIPALELDLPVLTDWSYTKLKKAPCLYYGTYYDENFVIAAHNYEAHFGRLPELRAGDIVVFTDVNGTAYYYEVVLLETLQKEAVSEMITSGFDLSLYTCTPGGANRVTVRCNLKEMN